MRIHGHVGAYYWVNESPVRNAAAHHTAQTGYVEESIFPLVCVCVCRVQSASTSGYIYSAGALCRVPGCICCRI